MVPSSPSVSILLSNYNGARFLNTSLWGICNQTRPADEIVLIDDGSTDNSLEIINTFKKKYQNIKLLKNEMNKGVIYSITRALNEAKSDYIVWAASDDLLLPNFLEESLKILSKYPSAGVCFSQLGVFVDGTSQKRLFGPRTNGRAFNLGESPSFLTPKMLFRRLQKSYLWISANSALIKRDALLKIGGFLPELRWHADWFAVYAVAMKHGVCMIPEVLAMMREIPDSYSRSGMNNAKQQGVVLKTLIYHIGSPQNKDIAYFFKKRMSLFTPFGYGVVSAMVRCGKVLLAMKYIIFCEYTYGFLSKRVYKKIKSLVHLSFSCMKNKILNKSKMVYKNIKTLVHYRIYKKAKSLLYPGYLFSLRVKNKILNKSIKEKS